MTARYDIVIVGGGILGLATGLEITFRHPSLKVILLEKEDTIAQHQTDHNSGVIHSGIYYKPDSIKARNCVLGARLLREFCDEHSIEYRLCGKVVVAIDDSEIPMLEVLYSQGKANGVPGLKIIGPSELKGLEPHANGIKALHCPETGIVNYKKVAEAYAQDFKQNNGTISTGTMVKDVVVSDWGITVETTTGDLLGKYLINCAGLYADVVADMIAPEQHVRIVPFRGDYYMLSHHARSLVNGLIYPVPDPRFPFLGIHFTTRINGEVEVGPNAMLAFAREGYSASKVNCQELFMTLSFPGFWSMASRYWRMGMQEFLRSVSKTAFLNSAKRLVPEINEADLGVKGSGVRAQAMDREGRLLDDFRIDRSRYAIHVRNAPSPGATASLAIGRDIVRIAENTFALDDHKG